MIVLSCILITFGLVGVVIQTIYAFTFESQMAAYLGKAMSFAIVFLLPGIILYVKDFKKKGKCQNGKEVKAK
jgi:hypothetical protein